VTGTTTEGSAESWATLVARGDYRRVVESAEQRGIDDALRSASAGELGALADAARFIGRGDLARRALQAIRSRFAGSDRAASAAFLLGKLTEDLGRPKAAVEWYDRYLAEAPGGPLAPEAMGRRMLALQHNGDTDGSRRAAAEYLKRFPNGPYAGVARETAKP
jgi:TolA-binding protein